jgi:hypothetical protein
MGVQKFLWGKLTGLLVGPMTPVTAVTIAPLMRLSAMLKLTSEPSTDRIEDPDSATLGFDRRRAIRHDIEASATAICRNDAAGQRYRICPLTLENISDGGLAAVSPVPLNIDEPIDVYFAPHGSERGLELHGRVIRCLPAGRRRQASGYQVAIRFDPAVAA